MTADSKPRPQRPLRDSLISACVVGVLFSLHGMGTGLVFVIMMMALWLPYGLFVIVRYPERRRVQSLKIGIWVLMLSAVLSFHFIRHQTARSYADSIVQKIEQFRETQGRYPERLDEVGTNLVEMKDRLVVPYYSNRPQFYYANTMAAFHLWSYDFSQRQWIDQYD
jgi:hypothetical protein